MTDTPGDSEPFTQSNQRDEEGEMVPPMAGRPGPLTEDDERREEREERVADDDE